MFVKLALLFIILPILEIALLIEVGQRLSTLPTLGIILGTGLVGAHLASAQGRRALSAIQRKIARGQLPGQEIISGVLVLAAGIVLITPGLITDFVGIALLIPPVRRLIGRWIQKRLGRKIAIRAPTVSPLGDHWHEHNRPGAWHHNQEDIIDIDPENKDNLVD